MVSEVKGILHRRLCSDSCILYLCSDYVIIYQSIGITLASKNLQ